MPPAPHRLRILVVGGTRFIGRVLVAQCVAAGHHVRLFHRGTTPDPLGLPAVHGDVNDLLAHRDALGSPRPDAIVHCIAHTETHARDLVALAGGPDTRIIALGSQDAFDAFHDLVRGRDASDLPLDERSPAGSTRFYWRGLPAHADEPDYDKNLMADVLLAAHREGRARSLVLRLPMVWGPNDHQFAHRHGSVLRRILDGRTQFVLGAAQQSRILTFGYVENIAAAIVRALARPDLSGVYDLAEPKVRTFRRWADLYAAAAGTAFEYTIVPDALLDDETAHRPDAAQGHLIVSGERFRRDADFVDPVPLDEAIRRTLAYARAHPEVLGASPDYDGEWRRACEWRGWLASRTP